LLLNITFQYYINLKEILSENKNTFIIVYKLLYFDNCVLFFKSLGNLDDL